MISNPLNLMWITLTSVISLLGVYVLFGQKYVPVLICKVYKFGKVNKDGVCSPYIAQLLEVPKRWFVHFYMFACVFYILIDVSVWRKYFGLHSPTFMIYLLDTFGDVNRKASVTPEAVVICTILLTLQVFRRCYECLFVSVYSDASMNVVHYVIAFMFYFGVGLSLISEAPGFLHNDGFGKVQFSNSWFSWSHVVGVMFFLFGFTLQYHTHIRLANLRKDKNGKKVITLGHVMPTGGGFEFVSCPHYFAEIVMYLSVGIIMQSISWWLVCSFTLSNQIISGLFSHNWYKSNFKNYPISRKAVLPYLV